MKKLIILITLFFTGCNVIDPPKEFITFLTNNNLNNKYYRFGKLYNPVPGHVMLHYGGYDSYGILVVDNNIWNREDIIQFIKNTNIRNTNFMIMFVSNYNRTLE